MVVSLPGEIPETRPSDALVDAVKALSFAGSLNQIAEIVKHCARVIAAADGATFVLFYSGAKQNLCYYFDEEAISPLWKGRKFPMESCISGWAMLNKTQVSIPDVYKDDRIPEDAYRSTFVKSLVMTPVRRQQPIAAIGTYWSGRREASAEELLLLQTLADVTAVTLQKVEYEDRLQKQIAISETLNSFRKDLLSHITHDLKTSVIGFLRVIEGLRTGVPVDPSVIFPLLHKQSDEMKSILEKIIDVDQHLMREDLCVFNVSILRLIETADKQFSPKAQAAGISFRTVTPSFDEEDSLCLMGNEEWLQRLLTNLLNNAINFTPAGGSIELCVKLLEGRVIISVSDTGPGIPPQIRDRLFNRFWHDYNSGYYLGRGFGLYVCKQIVDAHEGEIKCDTSLSGTTFTISLPYTTLPSAT